jgi:UrcA family protein
VREGPDGQITAVVSTKDLDLTSEAGLKELQHRVKLAAWKACQQGDVLITAMHGQCEVEAMARAAEMQRRVIAEAAARTYAGAAATPVSFADKPEQ